MSSPDELIDAIVERHAQQFEALGQSREQTIGRRILAVPRALQRLGNRLRPFDPDQAVHTGHMLNVSVGLIADEFTQLLFRDVCTIVDMHPWHWRRQLDGIDVLFVESAWLGQHGHWQYLISAAGRRTPNPFPDLVAECKRRSIPTIFWNKEDPFGFIKFLDASAGFDLVASTESSTESWYRRLRPEAKFAAVPFGINPSIHNPVDARHDRLDRVIYTGSWITDDFAERREWGELMLGIAHERGLLDIYARNNQSFPPAIAGAVRGTLAATEVAHETKRYGAALNLNSITTGQTMLSRRVVETLGLGVPVISSPSPALDGLGEACAAVATADEVHQALDLALDADQRSARSWSAWTEAHRRFSWPAMLRNLLEMVDVEVGSHGTSVAWHGIAGEVAESTVRGWVGLGGGPEDHELRALGELALTFTRLPMVVVRTCQVGETPAVRTGPAHASAGAVVMVDRRVVSAAETNQLLTAPPQTAATSLTMVEVLAPA